MATTITRTTWTNDTGTPTTPVGDGTIINNARLQDIYAAFDAVLAGALTIGGVLGSEGFGTHSFSAGGAGGNILSVRNTTAGTGNYGRVQTGNDASASALTLTAYSTTHATIPNYSALESTQANGLILRTNGGAPLYLGTNGVSRVTIGATGLVSLDATTKMDAGFFAYNSASDAGVANNTDIDFDTEVYDEGGHFTGDTFTAPTTGRYELSAHVRLTNATGGALVMQPVFLVSNHASGINFGYESVAAGATVGFSGSVIVDMDAGDTATVRYFGGGACTVEGNGTQRYTWFSGRRVL